MRFGLTLACLIGALAGALPSSPASASDGAGLFALPPGRVDAEERAPLPLPEPPEASGPTLAALIERAIEIVVFPQAGEPRVVPLVSRGVGGGLRLVLPVCEDGCAQYTTRGVLFVAQRAADSPLAWLAALGGRSARAPEGPPGLASLREEARRARAKVPQEEESALPD
ncbi:hypothetical protein SOCEGT47_048310 [Sorangium cellulosum]|jgi:hypothetical protein|uniref:Secreted protein n=1 Tax=Sorangium cellulosum TaxID=56 RepID=A0A4P2Q4H4_SORCE|nr:hypothetical protein [Sorangium cellulosum]AUX24294.1 hypothetical protein SOCEGT47_048310 [Sorangium cellulosum]